MTARFPNAGVYNVGVRASDDRGGIAYASKPVRSADRRAARPARARPSSSRSSSTARSSAAASARLVASYKLREAGKAPLCLYRGKKRVKRLSTGSRKANKTYKVRIKPKKLKKGATYTVRLRPQRRRQAHAEGAAVGQAPVAGLCRRRGRIGCAADGALRG